jgi:transcriptional regulator with XRE-family HTH domain
MITKEDLGNRIRLVRKQRAYTLKDLERVSGFSATHISEIERGKTSPTIGALVKIAKALGKETSYFLEEEQLSEIAVVRRNERQALPEEAVKVHGEYLTPGIPGGRLNAYLIYLDPGEVKDVSYPAHSGEEGIYVVSGLIDVMVGERMFRLESGDSVHYPANMEHGFRNAGKDRAEMIFMSTKRVGKNSSSSGTTGRVF